MIGLGTKTTNYYDSRVRILLGIVSLARITSSQFNFKAYFQEYFSVQETSHYLPWTRGVSVIHPLYNQVNENHSNLQGSSGLGGAGEGYDGVSGIPRDLPLETSDRWVDIVSERSFEVFYDPYLRSICWFMVVRWLDLQY